MSHQEKIDRINAQLNTAESWQQRWQIEREANERLGKQASMVRTGVNGLKAKAIQAYSKHGSQAAAARAAGDSRAMMNQERLCIVQSARTAALDDVLELLDHIDRAD